MRFPTVQVFLTYKDNELVESSKFTALDIKFVVGPEAVHNAEVYVQWQQARGVDCLREVRRPAS